MYVMNCSTFFLMAVEYSSVTDDLLFLFAVQCSLYLEHCVYVLDGSVVFSVPEELRSLVPVGYTVYTIVLPEELRYLVLVGCTVYTIVLSLPEELRSLVPDGCTV